MASIWFTATGGAIPFWRAWLRFRRKVRKYGWYRPQEATPEDDGRRTCMWLSQNALGPRAWRPVYDHYVDAAVVKLFRQRAGLHDLQSFPGAATISFSDNPATTLEDVKAVYMFAARERVRFGHYAKEL